MSDLQSVPSSLVDAVLAGHGLSGMEDLIDDSSGSQPIEALTLELIEEILEEESLVFPAELIASTHAALLSGKHLLLMGPPGTGKTSLAEVIAEAADRAGVCSGFLPTTGSSDWTATDTVGGYWMSKGQDLEFVPGQLLQAIDESRWVVLDEMNRADIDRAIGPLFTVLSGKSTVLRYEMTRGGLTGKVSILASGSPVPPGTVPFVVPASWRIVATMNSADRDKLFEISQAFMRRLAVVDVLAPSKPDHIAILEEYATGDRDIDRRIGSLVSIPELPLGPAITIDCARYARARWQSLSDRGEEVSSRRIMREAIAMFVEPQMGGLSAPARADAREYLRRLESDRMGDVDGGMDPLDDVFGEPTPGEVGIGSGLAQPDADDPASSGSD